MMMKPTLYLYLYDILASTLFFIPNLSKLNWFHQVQFSLPLSSIFSSWCGVCSELISFRLILTQECKSCVQWMTYVQSFCIRIWQKSKYFCSAHFCWLSNILICLNSARHNSQSVSILFAHDGYNINQFIWNKRSPPLLVRLFYNFEESNN